MPSVQTCIAKRPEHYPRPSTPKTSPSSRRRIKNCGATVGWTLWRPAGKPVMLPHSRIRLHRELSQLLYIWKSPTRASLPAINSSVSQARPKARQCIGLQRNSLLTSTSRLSELGGGICLFRLKCHEMYVALDKPNRRIRSAFSDDFIRARLFTLDFVMGHLGLNYLETSAEKVAFSH